MNTCHTRPHPRPVAPSVETLESRRHFSATLSGSTLIVNGSPGDDTIQVATVVRYDKTILRSTLYVRVSENGFTSGSFRASYVDAISVYGNGGNDTIAVGAGIGNTYLNGGDGHDNISGGDGNDSIRGGNGDDRVGAGAGHDYVEGDAGNDNLDGGIGNDSVFGSDGDDAVFGYLGDDTLHGGDGNDSLYGYYGSDRIYGGYGDDDLFGQADEDRLYGEDGFDRLDGGRGVDFVYGGNHNDYIQAYDGTRDFIDGGAGWDIADVDHDGFFESVPEDLWQNVEFLNKH
jgi:Ca2+-binding RTX toxin-like protein